MSQTGYLDSMWLVGDPPLFSDGEVSVPIGTLAYWNGFADQPALHSLDPSRGAALLFVADCNFNFVRRTASTSSGTTRTTLRSLARVRRNGRAWTLVKSGCAVVPVMLSAGCQLGFSGMPGRFRSGAPDQGWRLAGQADASD